MVGAGSFGTAVAVLLQRGGLSTTLFCRTGDQAAELSRSRENARYLPGVALPERLRVAALADAGGLGGRGGLQRADLVFLAVPSAGLPAALAELLRHGLPRRAGVVSLAKGLMPPEGTPPAVALEAAFGAEAVACIGGPAHAREMITDGAGLVCASHSERLAHRVADVFQRAGVVCEVSSDPVGVELAGCAKNAAALAAGATESQGLNAAGMAAADIFTEVAALARRLGGSGSTFLGRAGIGDLVATALPPISRNRRAGELLAEGVPAAEIPERLGQACEALETVPLLARAIQAAGLEAPTVSGLADLIEGRMPLERWVKTVRAQQPPPARFRRSAGWWLRLRAWLRSARRK